MRMVRNLMKQRSWWLLLAAFVVCAAAYKFFFSAGLVKTGGGAAGSKDQQHPVPVTTATAEKANLDVYLNALGTVTPVNTATVKSQVSGQLLRIHFREGQMVKVGDLLAEIDSRPFEVQLTQAEGQLTRDEALLKNAENDLARYAQLLAQDSIAEQQAAAQESLVRQLRGTVKTDEGLIANARLQIIYSKVVAPISGRLGLRQVDIGNIIQTNDVNGLVVITQLQPITVVFSVPQDNLPIIMKRLHEGTALPVHAYSQDGKDLVASGRVLAVDNQIDTTTGTVKLKASFANEDNRLFANQFVNVRMRVDTMTGATVIPTSAVQRGSVGTFVYVIRGDNRTTIRPVRLGPTEEDSVAVTEGLVPGERVVVVGGDKLREGSSVETAEGNPPAASPDRGRKASGRMNGMGKR